MPYNIKDGIILYNKIVWILLNSIDCMELHLIFNIEETQRGKQEQRGDGSRWQVWAGECGLCERSKGYGV